jgi:hydroxyacylglutathione hydrolase
MPKRGMAARATIIPVTPFQQNCTLLWCDATRRAAVVDPGGDLDRVTAAIASAKVAVDNILLTHGHIDHAGGAAELKDRLAVPIEGPHRADEPMLRRLAETGRAYGISTRPVTPDRWLDDGDKVTIGELVFDVLHCPGHSPGSVVLFRGSVGRTDLPGGDHRALLASIRNKLLPLGDDVAFICGHGPTSTIGEERATNPFLRAVAPPSGGSSG